MPKNDNVKSIRLYDSVKSHVDQTAADKMAETVYLSKSADFKRKFKWAEDVSDYLNSNFGDEQIKNIRMDCSCAPSPKHIEAVKKLYQSSDNPKDFCEKYNTDYAGKHSVWYDNGEYFFSYPRCMCDCIQRVNRPISKTWCLCTLGYTKKMFDAVFDCETKVELIESIKTGGSRCFIKIIKDEVSNL